MDDDHRLPIDRGWAWAILLACTLESLLMIGTMKSFGVFFVEFVSYYEASSSEISAVLSARTISISIVALFVLSAGAHCLENRWFVLIGCVFAFLSYIACAFAPDVDTVMLSQGIFWGMAVGLAHGPTLVMVGKYFNKRRGLANSLANIGGGIGGLIFPPLIRVMLDFYGLQGTLIIFSGIMLNVSLIAALLRPLKFYSRLKSSAKKSFKTESNKASNINNSSTTEALLKENGISKNTDLREKLDMTKYSAKNDTKDTIHLSYELLSPRQNGRFRTQSTNCAVLRHSQDKTDFGSVKSIDKYLTSLSRNNLDIFRGSEEAIASLPRLPTGDTASKDEDNSCLSSASNTLKKLFNFKVLKNRRFNLFMLAGFVAISGNAFVVLYLPAHANDVGISHTKAALLVSIVQGTDIVSRVCMAFILDKGILKRHQLLSIALLITGTACQLLPFFTEFWSLTLFAVIYGFFGGLYFAIYPVIIVDFVGIECLSTGMAIMMLLHGISLSSIAPVLGALRDRTGSYLTSYHVMGSGSITGALILLFEPLVKRWQNDTDMTLNVTDHHLNKTDSELNDTDTKQKQENL